MDQASRLQFPRGSCPPDVQDGQCRVSGSSRRGSLLSKTCGWLRPHTLGRLRDAQCADYESLGRGGGMGGPSVGRRPKCLDRPNRAPGVPMGYARPTPRVPHGTYVVLRTLCPPRRGGRPTSFPMDWPHHPAPCRWGRPSVVLLTRPCRRGCIYIPPMQAVSMASPAFLSRPGGGGGVS